MEPVSKSNALRHTLRGKITSLLYALESLDRCPDAEKPAMVAILKLAAKGITQCAEEIEEEVMSCQTVDQ